MGSAAAEAREGGGVPARMRAWQYRAFGGGAAALELAEGVAVPAPRRAHVVVRTQATSLNALDYKLQDGFMRPLLPASLPFIPGLDVAGEVVALPPGPDGAACPFQLGDQVFGCVPVPVPGGGAFAEYVLLPVAMTAPRPAAVTAPAALSLVVAGCAALQALRDFGGIPLGPVLNARLTNTEATPPPRLNVLVANASGGVGIVAVQLLKMAGQHVTATCGARNMEYIRSLGADEVLDYRSPEGQRLQSPSGCKYDVVLDGTVHLTWKEVQPVLAARAKWLHLSPSPAVLASAALSLFSQQRLVPVTTAAKTADLELLAGLVAQGSLKVAVDSEFPFSQLPDAWKKCQEGRYLGKIVVNMV